MHEMSNFKTELFEHKYRHTHTHTHSSVSFDNRNLIVIYICILAMWGVAGPVVPFDAH